ncbi:unnamed protein product [Linum tenue]|uniref:FHA domain-containing protein n=1 Tax=Linum tenue TaxID=586396 RepID=A0AAV0GZ15_9ROSI|nr:unnamed protein product [Linum tenue]
MEAPSLTLVVLEGPRKGETFDFRPGSTVRIGRVVRGNTFAIKDAGISSKHLAIDSESGKWTVEDLDSSNGTTLNSSQLPPLQQHDLRDGDEIKLGELTSLVVRLRIENQNPSPPQRRGGRKQVAASVQIAQAEARISAEAENLSPSVPKRGRQRKARVPVSQNTEPPLPGVGRVTRSKKNEPERSTSDCVESGLPEKKRNAPTRKGRKKEPAPPPENDNAVATEIKDGQELRASLANEAREGDGRISVVEIKPSSASEAQEGDANRVSAAEIKGNEDLRQNLAEEARQADGCEAVVAETEELIQQLDSDEQQCEAPTKDGPNSNEHRGQKSEKMTLRDWFRYMEVRLTKETVEASEKMIDEMREKAVRVQEYMIEQKARNKAS